VFTASGLRHIEPLAPRPYSFRDPDSRLTLVGDRVVRYVRPEIATDLRAFLSSHVYERLTSHGALVSTKMSPTPDGGALLEHPRIFFPSYSWEWTRSMWVDAGRLTLELARTLVERGFVLKDATPSNVLFQGTIPIFVDFGSIVRRSNGSPLWPGYAQFVRTFVLPLIAERLLGWPLALTAYRRDGYEPDELYRQLGWLSRFRPSVLSAVTLPAQLAKWIQSSGVERVLKHKVDDEKARDALSRCFRRLESAIENAAATPSESPWSNYNRVSRLGQERSCAEKQAFVERALCRTRPRTILDIGANVGTYCRLAASTGGSVVGVERDIEACDINFRLSRDSQSSVLPLAVDIARPSPAMGWNNEETFSFNSRAQGRFDLVLLLAVIHHLLVLDQIPLAFLVDMLSRYSRRFLLVEWVPPEDPRFRELARGRDSLFRNLTPEYARAAFAQRFDLLQQEQLNGGRLLWLLEKNAVQPPQ